MSVLISYSPEGERVDLPGVSSTEATHDVQSWYSVAIADMVAARLHISWNDQGWGNQKGAMHARVATSPDASLPSTVLFPWRRIGPYPAPHQGTPADIVIPKQFFLNQVHPLILSVTEDDPAAHICIPTDDPASAVSTAVWGIGDQCEDVTDLVKEMLAAGTPVTATKSGSGPGICATLSVTLKEDVKLHSPVAMPEDAHLELGYEVGGGGGHALRIQNAYLLQEKMVTVLLAAFPPGEVILTTMAGEKFATVSNVTDEITDENRTEMIRSAVVDILGPGVGFKVISSD